MPTTSVLFAVTLAVAGACAVLACSSSEERACKVGADCASGVCTEDGICAAAPTGGGDAATEVNSGPSDAGELTDATLLDAAIPGCVPNKDGIVTREEVPLQAGLRATFRVATNETISTAGVPAGNDLRTWDLSGSLPSDADALVETLPVAGRWFEDTYPNATYATRLSQSVNLLGLFQVAPGGLTLGGVVSPDEGTYATELTYDPPVPAVVFPLEKGKTWTTNTNVSGLAQGVYSTYSEKYETEVDARGDLKTPLGTFHVLRVRTLLTRTIGWYTVKVRSFAFVTECYGTVATVTSKDDEPNAEFTMAKELRRIAP